MPDCKHLLVDGYNILHTWPKLKDLIRVNLAVARDRLSEAVRIIHDYEGIRTTLIFDGRGREIEIERPSKESTFSYLFTPSGSTADKIIEELVAKADRPQDILVASHDNMIRETVNALGAQTLSPEALVDWVHACERAQTEKLKRMNNKSDSLWKQRQDQ